MRFVILGSGRGSNAETLLKAWKSGALGGAEPVGIFSDKPDARILELGATFGVPAESIDSGPFKTKLDAAAEDRYVAAIRATGTDLIVLAGFMRVLKAGFLDAFPKQIINLHPSLLPSFKGLDGIGQAFRYGVKVTGCTVHYVTGELDGGPIIDQEVVRIEESDTEDSLAERMHAAEHRLLPAVVRRLAEEL
jgi:phosphoribosylglycinamide formyltransferase-1|tara:strand:+ start:4185 stop:4760 length:576 start_codon:yes stop_codon:yes gene_type:complete